MDYHWNLRTHTYFSYNILIILNHLPFTFAHFISIFHYILMCILMFSLFYYPSWYKYLICLLTIKSSFGHTSNSELRKLSLQCELDTQFFHSRTLILNVCQRISKFPFWQLLQSSADTCVSLLCGSLSLDPFVIYSR